MEHTTLLDITTIQEESGEQMQLTTEALCKKYNTGVQFSYTENLSDDDHTHSTLTILPDCVMVAREGSYSANMFFEENKTHQCEYNTGEGIMDMRIFTSHLKTIFEKDHVDADICYHLSLDGISAGSMRMKISARTGC